VASHFGHPGIEDAATVQLGFADGAVATLVSIWHQVLSRPSTRRLEVFCEEAFLWTDDDYLGPVQVETSSGAETLLGEPPPFTARFELPEVLAKPLAAYAEPAKRFLDGLVSAADDAPGYPDVDVALAAHRLVDAAYRSAARAGTPVPFVPSR
jgi:predicted dehydrogenase